MATNDLQVRPVVSSPAKDSPLDTAVRVLHAADANGDGVIEGGRYQPEVTDQTDRLAKLVYDYADYVNPDGRTSFYGPSSRGDVMEGGLGMGFTLRPKHYTSFGRVSKTSLDRGVGELRAKLAGRADDGADRDLSRLMAAGRAAGLLASDDAEALRQLHAGLDGLLTAIMKQVEKSERDRNQETVVLTWDELRAGLTAPDGSVGLAGLIANELTGPATSDPKTASWYAFYARELAFMQGGGGLALLPPRTAQSYAGEFKRYLAKNPIAKPGLVDDPMQHYLLVLSKRAKEGAIVTEIRAELATRMQAERTTSR